jgi:hypothetical protein
MDWRFALLPLVLLLQHSSEAEQEIFPAEGADELDPDRQPLL